MNANRRSAFTLVELLVAIGIIIVLVSILVPVVTRVRLASQNAATQALVQKISGAVQAYYNDFQAYPGAIPNIAFANGTAGSGTYFSSSPGATYTQSEDLVLALLGGSSASAPPPPIKISYNQNYIGRGPVTYNHLNPEQKKPYLDKIADELAPIAPNGIYVPLNSTLLEDNALSYATDSLAPEFMDRFNASRPILYVRGNPGANPANPVYNGRTSGWQKLISYDCGVIQPYVNNWDATQTGPKDFPRTPTPSSGPQTWVTGGNIDPASAPAKYMFADSAGRARGNGTYLLISAGTDRQFGTLDDIIYAGGGGQ